MREQVIPDNVLKRRNRIKANNSERKIVQYLTEYFLKELKSLKN